MAVTGAARLAGRGGLCQVIVDRRGVGALGLKKELRL
jgi:hypothetical protein